MHETYEDCPYYEQMQFVMDTRLQALFTYAVSTDTRLAAKAIEDFHCSLLPEGIVQAKFPSSYTQIIPTFSLHWIFMLHEYYWQTGDVAFVKRFRPTVDAILDWYDRKIGKNGLVEKLGYWEFVDWLEEWQDIGGVPRAATMGPSTIINLMYAYALRNAQVLNSVTGRKDTAQEYEHRAEDILNNVRILCWSEDKGMFKEGPELEQYTQHAQAWAVLNDVLPLDEANELMKKTLIEKDVLKCTFSTSYELFRALEKTGLYSQTNALTNEWVNLLKYNSTTCSETPRNSRSECHAWSALPIFEFVRCILGVRPLEPGWESIEIKPHITELQKVRGNVVTPKGNVSIDWELIEGDFHIKGRMPERAGGVVYLPDGMNQSYKQGESFELSCCLKKS